MIKNSYPTEELQYEYQTHHSQQQDVPTDIR